MLPRRTLAAGILLLALPVSACGFDYATDQVYNASRGTNHRAGQVDVLSAVIVSESETGGSGTFIASFANNNAKDSDTVTEIASGPDGPPLTVEGFKPVEVAPGQLVNLANTQGFVTTGEFKPGDFVSVKISFANAEEAEMRVPVVAATDEYAGLDISGSASTETEQPTEGPTTKSTGSKGKGSPDEPAAEQPSESATS